MRGLKALASDRDLPQWFSKGCAKDKMNESRAPRFDVRRTFQTTSCPGQISLV